ncbi:hypothetical protein [Nguyenibacter vanlangensis]|uniref:Uncharacterized protein n=1 Tax=Nguyenibacter vanlangensis TaxID=1216886 RepID=A0A7Y7M484_9PROT|nr:hypothetical protein [Nguyenibacter vanlangensis]NVN09712.1 hypothetical protein [Nguyenibacter vanlangensis]
MNIFAAAGGATAAVNPSIQATLKQSTGSTPGPGFRPIPTYAEIPVMIEVQALSSQDLQQVENISQQADMRIVYVVGEVRGIARGPQTGGDMFNFYGSDWLVTQQLEEWGAGEWSKLVVTRQTPSPSI